VLGALNDTLALWLKVLEKLVLPPKSPLLSGWLAVMLTPLFGLDEDTVSVLVTGGAGTYTAVSV
jgi:hypothetical protein